MSPRGKRLWIGTACWLVLPAGALALWLWSGGPLFTGTHAVVEVRVQDAFGDPAWESRLVPGPVAGYYVGLLDVVAASVAAWLALTFGTWLVLRWSPTADSPPAAAGIREDE